MVDTKIKRADVSGEERKGKGMQKDTQRFNCVDDTLFLKENLRGGWVAQ